MGWLFHDKLTVAKQLELIHCRQQLTINTYHSSYDEVQSTGTEQILNGTSAQLGYTVPFTSVHAGKYGTEDKLNTDAAKTEHNPVKVNNTKYSKTKLAWFSHVKWHSVRKRGGLILQCSRAHAGHQLSRYPPMWHGRHTCSDLRSHLGNRHTDRQTRTQHRWRSPPASILYVDIHREIRWSATSSARATHTHTPQLYVQPYNSMVSYAADKKVLTVTSVCRAWTTGQQVLRCHRPITDTARLSLTLSRPLLPYGYSYKASCVTSG